MYFTEDDSNLLGHYALSTGKQCVNIYNSTRHNIPKNVNPHQFCCKRPNVSWSIDLLRHQMPLVIAEEEVI